MDSGLTSEQPDEFQRGESESFVTVNKSIVFKFGDVEVREREFRLVKAGEVLPVEPKTFRVLLFLLRNPQKLIAKEELLNAVWGDAAVTESSLTRTIAQLRRLLGDEIRSPRYIETVATVGYRFLQEVQISEDGSGNVGGLGGPNDLGSGNGAVANRDGGAVSAVADPMTQIQLVTQGETVPASAPGGGVKEFRRRWLVVPALIAIGLAVAIWYLRRPLPPPRIAQNGYIRITHDGQGKFLGGTDGNRLYFTRSDLSIAEVAISGGEIERVQVALPAPILLDVSPDGSELLVSSREAGKWSLSSVQVPGGSLRHLADNPVARTYVASAAWAPDGRSIAYCTGNGDIYLIRSDGTDIGKLVSVTGRVEDLSWSPDGRTIRFSKDHLLWEVSSRGSGLHQMLTGSKRSSLACCGRWTSDGEFFLFLSGDSLLTSAPYSPEGELWALDERRGIFRRPSSRPIQLTSGPTHWGIPIPARSGKKIFAAGVTRRGELVRFDSQSKQFQPYLDGISSEYVSFSKDGRSVAYVSFPDGILWRANRDGSGRVQLSDPPSYPKLPRWSPDGTQILFMDVSPRGFDETFILSSEGGKKPKPLLPEEDGPYTDANWSPDGQKIVFSTLGGKIDRRVELRILDVASRKVTVVPGSERMWSPRWSPDGRYIAGMMFRSSADLRVFDFQTKQWSVLQKGPIDLPTWSQDGQFIYFMRMGDGVFRVPVSGGEAIKVVDLNGFQQTGWWGDWMGLDPTDAPLFLRDVGTDDIYALTLEEK